MAERALRNFHLPLPEVLYEELKAEATRQRKPATVVARTALEEWFRQRKKEQLHRQIAEYAAKNAAKSVDLDEDLEAASVESLTDEPGMDE